MVCKNMLLSHSCIAPHQKYSIIGYGQDDSGCDNGSRIDYCNFVLYGTSAKNIRKLQKVQNTLARVVTIRRRSEHIRIIYQFWKHLHWLPIEHRIIFKIATLTYKIRQSYEPGYLASICLNMHHQETFDPRANSSWPSHEHELSHHRVDSQLHHPRVWNDIPLNIKLQETIAGFKRHLKKFYLNLLLTRCDFFPRLRFVITDWHWRVIKFL